MSLLYVEGFIIKSFFRLNKEKLINRTIQKGFLLYL